MWTFFGVAIALLPVLIPLLYTFIITSVLGPRLPILRNKRVCLLIAHPDDEAMFFAPTVLALTRPEAGNHVKILCLSSGNADGLGETRKKELVKSATMLGIRTEDDVDIVESQDFPDSMTIAWDDKKISTLLLDTFTARTAGSSEPTVDVLITFDGHGVSSHPNHISLYHGARTFLAALAPSTSPPPIVLYTLTTVSLLRKYTGIVDILTTTAACSSLLRRPHTSPPISSTTDDPSAVHTIPDGFVFTNAIFGPGPNMTTAWATMTTAHKSQMVWFRWGWILLSRYMVINDLRREVGHS